MDETISIAGSSPSSLGDGTELSVGCKVTQWTGPAADPQPFCSPKEPLELPRFFTSTHASPVSESKAGNAVGLVFRQISAVVSMQRCWAAQPSYTAHRPYH